MLCSKCNCKKEVTEFFKDKQRKSGYQRYCKQCSMELINKRNSGNWDNYFKSLLAIRKNVKHALSVEILKELYSKQKGLCALTGVKLTSTRGKGKVATNCSIDRIIAGSAYEPNNIRLVCCAVNEMKNNRTDEELLMWCRKVIDGANC